MEWQDIKGWRSVGTRWAEALDANGTTIALYDLSYPTFTDELAAIHLGRIGEGRVTAESMLKLFEPAPEQIDDGSHPQLTPDQIAAAVTALKANPSVTDRFPDNWWKSLPWKTSFNTDSAPESFTLADIDWEAMATDKVKFESELNTLTSQTVGEGGPPLLGPGFLASFYFQRDPQSGAYDLYWHKPSTNSSDPTPSRPEKVLDLTNPQLGWYDQLIWEGISDGVGELVSLIPGAVVSGLLGSVVGLFFQFRTQLSDAHLNMMLEDLSPTVAGSYGISSLLSDLNAAQSKTVEIATCYSTLGEVQPALWWNLDVSQVWSGNRLAEENTSIRETTWLRTNAKLGETLSLRSTLVDGFPGIPGAPASGTSGIAVVASQPNSKQPQPLLAIDYTQPNRITDYRILMDALNFAIGFATGFIPFSGGTVVDEIFTSLYMDPISSAQKWEARLKTVIEARTDKDWSVEIDTIDRQAQNPFELNRVTTADLIARRKKWLGI